MISHIVNILAALLAAYVLLESLGVAAQMNGGDRFCRMARWVLAMWSAAAVLMFAAKGQADRGHLLMIACLALFIWPKTWGRYFFMERRGSGRRKGDRHDKGNSGDCG